MDTIVADDLLKILRPLQSKEQANYKLFVSMIDYIIAEDTPLGKQLGVINIMEHMTDYNEEFDMAPDIRIHFESDEAMLNFVNILKSAGLIQARAAVGAQDSHFAAKKQSLSKNPKVAAHMRPRVMFYAVDYQKDLDLE